MYSQADLVSQDDVKQEGDPAVYFEALLNPATQLQRDVFTGYLGRDTLRPAPIDRNF